MFKHHFHHPHFTLQVYQGKPFWNSEHSRSQLCSTHLSHKGAVTFISYPHSGMIAELEFPLSCSLGISLPKDEVLSGSESLPLPLSFLFCLLCLQSKLIMIWIGRHCFKIKWTVICYKQTLGQLKRHPADQVLGPIPSPALTRPALVHLHSRDL